MIGVLSKPTEQITAGDIQALIDSEVPEGEQIEFKEKPPSRDASGDPWMRGENRIGDRAKKELLEEVVAFANAYSGTLLLGVKESDAKPPVASEIAPIPRCAEFADRLRNVFRDCVEPQIPRIEIFAVRTKDDSGVVIFRVGRSRLAPHRVTMTLECPVRRADRCEGMSMREIQDMTLNVARGLERLEVRLSERAERFSQEFRVLKTPEEAFGFRLTAVPVGEEIRFDRVFRRHRPVEGLEEPWHNVSSHIREKLRTLDTLTEAPNYWRPLLRGARAESHNIPYIKQSRHNHYREIHCDGLIELGFVMGSQAFQVEIDQDLPQKQLFVLFANLASQAHRVRSQAGVPMAEYAIEVETYVQGGDARPMSPTERYLPEDILSIGATKFPRYSLGGRDEIPHLVNLFYRDFWNHLGRDIGDEEDSLTIQGWPSQE